MSVREGGDHFRHFMIQDQGRLRSKLKDTHGGWQGNNMHGAESLGCSLSSSIQDDEARLSRGLSNVKTLRAFARASACSKGESEPATPIISFLVTMDFCCREEEVGKWLKQGILYWQEI